MKYPDCDRCKHYSEPNLCDRKLKVVSYNFTFGVEIWGNYLKCDKERNGFTLLGFPDRCGKLGKYWESNVTMSIVK